MQIIAKLWSAVYDLIFLIKGESGKTLDQIEKNLDLIEYACRRYVDDSGEEQNSERNIDADIYDSASGVIGVYRLAAKKTEKRPGCEQ